MGIADRLEHARKGLSARLPGNLRLSDRRGAVAIIAALCTPLLIGGLAIVAWRLWGKKKREQAAAVDDFGMGTAGSPRDSLGREKQTSASSHAPTLSTSSYRNPNGVVNTASNF